MYLVIIKRPHSLINVLMSRNKHVHSYTATIVSSTVYITDHIYKIASLMGQNEPLVYQHESLRTHSDT